MRPHFFKIFFLYTNFFQILVYHKVYLKFSASPMLLKILYPNLHRVSIITPSLGIFQKKTAVGPPLPPFAAIFRRPLQKNFPPIFFIYNQPCGGLSHFFKFSFITRYIYLKLSAFPMLLKILDPNLYRVSIITQSLGIFKKTVAELPFTAKKTTLSLKNFVGGGRRSRRDFF